MDLNQQLENYLNKAEHAYSNIPWEKKPVYANWLSQTYYYVQHTSRFLELLTESYQAHEDKEKRKQAEHHKEEEEGHEQLLLEDMKHLGEELKNYPEYLETQNFYNKQYKYLENKMPHAHLGYSLFLEGVAAKCGGIAFHSISKLHGAKTAQFLKVHAIADEGHFDEGLKTLQTLTVQEKKDILESLNYSAPLYLKIIEKIKKQS